MSKLNKKAQTGCRIKCVLVGDGAVGKTCMLTSYTTGQFPSGYVPTVFDNHNQPMIFNGLTINLELWDTAGQEGYARIRPLAYANCDVFVICFDVTNRVSLENVKKIWTPELKSHCKDVPLVLVGTKIDLRMDKSTSKGVASTDRKAGENMATEVKAVKYLECSALTQDGLKDVFECAVQAVLRDPQETVQQGCFGSCNIL